MSVTPEFLRDEPPDVEAPLGDYDAELTVHGVSVHVTYDLEGRHYSATETDPEEFPTVEIVSVALGGGPPLYGADAIWWDEQLELTQLVENQS